MTYSPDCQQNVIIVSDIQGFGLFFFKKKYNLSLFLLSILYEQDAERTWL